MKRVMYVCLFSSLFFAACKKKESTVAAAGTAADAAARLITCSRILVTEKPVKVGATAMVLPAGTKLCLSADNLAIHTELPEGYVFLSRALSFTERSLPVFATYACYCSVVNSTCQVFYSEEQGFGCLQSSCTGSCTGKFTYKGYSVDRVINLADKTSFFGLPEVQEEIRELVRHVSPTEAYGKFSILGLPFYFVQDEKAFLEKASCDCEGTKACKLKVVDLAPRNGEPISRKIYFCEGGCNGCELTIQ